jgi:hypothetical protein
MQYDAVMIRLPRGLLAPRFLVAALPRAMVALAIALSLALLTGCVSKAKEALQGPEPEGGGTLSCKEIVEECDSQCSDPLCVNRCTPQGTDQARGQHQALIDCGQSNGCTDQSCMEQNCAGEIQTCMGPAEPPSEPPASPAPGPDTSGQQESS